MNDRIAKQRLNIILLIDTSTSMRGERIQAVNHAILDIKDRLVEMEKENSNVDFYLSIITFSTEASLYHQDKMKRIDDFRLESIHAGGWSYLDKGYGLLISLLEKEKNGGIMPDFGGLAPIIMVLTDGHPTGEGYTEALHLLEKKPWFHQAIRYGVAIGLNDTRTRKVLKDFVLDNGDVIDCIDSNKLQEIIRIIVLTASKVRSSSTSIEEGVLIHAPSQVKAEVKDALTDMENVEW